MEIKPEPETGLLAPNSGLFKPLDKGLPHKDCDNLQNFSVDPIFCQEDITYTSGSFLSCGHVEKAGLWQSLTSWVGLSDLLDQ